MTKHTSISLPKDVVIGKDLLELVTSAMYVDPLTIYREYIQNAVDSIDEAKEMGIIKGEERGRIDIHLNLARRSILIRDNGTGVPNGEFGKRLTALGGSKKRGTSARGFRGIGRLAGLGYCQTLIFRSRSKGDLAVQELRWDCRSLKRLITDPAFDGGIQDVIKSVATINEIDSDGYPEHFYEVELDKPIRIKNDLLLNRDEIQFYLSQVAPVPFNPNFKFSKEIILKLNEYCKLSDVDIFFDEMDTPIYRPYKNSTQISDDRYEEFNDLEFRVIDGLNDGVSAVVWVLHHGYHGAIPSTEGIRGLRARKGNIQVGEHKIFADVYPETRFNSWTVGEVHILDPKVIPNGRRDDFEQNAHYSHVIHQLSSLGDHIARLCRSNSIVRNRIKTFDIGANKIEEKIKIIEQGALSGIDIDNIMSEIRSELFEIKKAAESPVLTKDNRESLLDRHAELDNKITIVTRNNSNTNALNNFPEKEQEIIKKIIGLIYDCSANRIAAKSLVDRILAKIGENVP